MKALALTSLIASLFNFLSGCPQRPPAQPTPTPTAEVVVLDEKGASPEAVASLRRMLFSDQPLEEFVGGVRPDGPGAGGEPWGSFRQALAHTKRGQSEEAKKDLRRVLSMPGAETRVKLSAWTALRDLGERPPPGVAERVEGVVCELHNEAGVGTLAAYADGSARWLGGKGAVTIWDAPGTDKEIDSLVGGFLKAAAPLAGRAPAAGRHDGAEVALNHFRVSVLTPGGVHVVDVFGPDVDERHFAAPVLLASMSLLDRLSEKSGQRNR